MSWDDMPSLEDMAYESAHDSFQAAREHLIDQATDAHERGDEVTASALLAQARAMTFTGLDWNTE